MGWALSVGRSARATPARKGGEVVSWGFIGLGARGRYLLRQAVKLPDVRVAALCDLKPEALDKAMHWVGEQRPVHYRDHRRMIEAERLDGILVATEVGHHAAVSVPLLEAGYNVFCEKPLEASVEAVDRFTRAARQAKGVCQIGLQRRYKAGYHEAFDAIRQGKVGDARYLQAWWKWDWFFKGGWMCDIKLSGGAIVEQGVHHLDMLSRALGDQAPLRAVSMGGIARPNAGESVVEDHSFTTFTFPGGVTGQYTHLFGVGTKAFCGEGLRMFGTTGGIELDRGWDYHGSADWYAYDNAKPPKKAQLSKGSSDHEAGTINELRAFARHCREGGTPLANIEVARRATLMGIMARMAMFDTKRRAFRSREVTWDDLGTTTDQRT